ncbi:putative Ulp1 protease family catalytic domain, papain-like cysteine peptidase superfamily [Helianthus anomalus]
MRPGFYAHVNIIQSWGHILKYEERYKAPKSPSRLFCTQIILNTPAYIKTTSYRYKEFNNNMEYVLKLARFKEDQKDRKINEYDLVFVPIIWKKNFYVVCFNLKHNRVDVLDNNAGRDTPSIKKTYDGWVKKLVSILKTLYVETMLAKRHTNIRKNVKLQQDAFAIYLLIQIYPMAKIMKSAPIVIQYMNWRTKSNEIDCGIFAMRHMERIWGSWLGMWSGKRRCSK